MITESPNLKWFRMVVAEFLDRPDTIIMGAAEFGAYVRLLLNAFRMGPDCALPADDAKLARILRLSLEEWQQYKPAILPQFEQADGKLINPWIKAEWDKALAEYNRTSAARVAKQEKRNKNAGV